MKIIAVSGFKQSGKDTLANYLIANKGYCRVSFADPLKDMVAEEYNIPREHCDNPKFKEAPILHLPVNPKDKFTLNLSKMLLKEFRSAEGNQAYEHFQDVSGAFLGVTNPNRVEQLYWTPRTLCILKGSVNRAVRSDYWVDKTITTIETTLLDKANYTGNFVISDLRYKSEVEQLKQAFGKNLVTIRVNRFDTTNSDDPSENDLTNYKFDITIDNKGTLEEFYAKIEELC